MCIGAPMESLIGQQELSIEAIDEGMPRFRHKEDLSTETKDETNRIPTVVNGTNAI